MSDDNQDYCSNCQYELLGLPRFGNCPECGAYYDKLSNTGVLKSRHLHKQKIEHAVAVLKLVALPTLGSLILIIGLAISFFTASPGIPLLFFGLLATPFFVVFAIQLLTSKTQQ